MRTTHHEEAYIPKDSLTDRLFDGRAVFFDIETTGFSPANTSLYLIGCARRTGDSVLIDQFFAESPEDEQDVLGAFLESLAGCDTLISYNGLGFDIPYLRAKCKAYGLTDPFTDFHYIDIFKSISRYRFLLSLENYKQKSLEVFLGKNRDDRYNGGELIGVYLDYVKKPSDESLQLLLLHNYEDVTGMIDLLVLLSYEEFFAGNYTVLSARVETYRAYDGTVGRELLVTLRNQYPVPKRCSHRMDDFYLVMDKERSTIRVPVCDGELRYFLPNYKDYYYLPDEDMAVHRSVAAFVDKAFRRPARASTCYTRKSGSFLPQCSGVFTPEFRREYNDKTSYFELTEELLSSDEMLRRYIDHILKQMCAPRKKH